MSLVTPVLRPLAASVTALALAALLSIPLVSGAAAQSVFEVYRGDREVRHQQRQQQSQAVGASGEADPHRSRPVF